MVKAILFKQVRAAFSASIVALIGALVIVPQLVPASFWFEYQSVEPVRDQYEIGQPILMRSTREVFRVHDIGFSDTLYCSLDGDRDGFRYTSNYPTSSIQADPTDGVERKNCNYNAEGPQSPATCRVHSVQWVQHFFGRSYGPEIISRDFRVE
jgi:hypothetical protein